MMADAGAKLLTTLEWWQRRRQTSACDGDEERKRCLVAVCWRYTLSLCGHLDHNLPVGYKYLALSVRRDWPTCRLLMNSCKKYFPSCTILVVACRTYQRCCTWCCAARDTAALVTHTRARKNFYAKPDDFLRNCHVYKPKTDTAAATVGRFWHW